MITISLILNLVLSLALAYVIMLHKGVIKDKDKDFKSDSLEAKAEEIKEKAGIIKTRLAEEIADIKEAIKEVGNQIDDIPDAFKTKRKGRKK